MPIKNKIFFLSLTILLSWGLFTDLVLAEYGNSPQIPTSLTFCGETVPLKQAEVFEAVDQELVLLVGTRSRVWLTLRQQNRILSIVDDALKASNSPSDLRYAAMGMSNLTPDYRAGNGRGIWRLSKTQAANFNLTVNQNLDERLDPYKSTLAVAENIKKLKNNYGNWTLATVATLGHSSEVDTLVADSGLKDYYQLPLSAANTTPFSWVLAAKILYSNPSQYGYKDLSGLRPLYKREINKSATTISALAAKFGLSAKAVKDANPHILEQNIPVGANIYKP